METKEFKAVNHEFKAIQEGKNLYIEGYASVFGNLDSYNDIVAMGAFTKTISGVNGKRIKLCYQHDFDKVIGKIEELREDATGLWFKAKISNTTLGKDVAELITDGSLDEISIGYRSNKWAYDERQEVRTITEVELYEISVVTRAANAKATITSTEAKEEGDKPIFDIAKLSDEDLTEKQKQINEEISKRILEKI